MIYEAVKDDKKEMVHKYKGDVTNPELRIMILKKLIQNTRSYNQTQVIP